MISILQKTYAQHLLAWFLVSVLIFGALMNSIAGIPGGWGVPLVLVIFIMAAAYSALFIHSSLFDKNRPITFFLLLFSLPVAFVFLFELTVVYFDASSLTGFFQNYMNFAMVMGVAIGVRYFKRGAIAHLLLQETKERLLESEVKNLTSQLHPHFLFNTLNNMYALNLKDAGKGSEMILALSDLLRYQLETQKQQLVSLQDEIDFITNYLSLERLRLTSRNQINFNSNISNASARIAPSLFMPFVENAVKYGVQPDVASDVKIELCEKEGRINFTSSNAIFKGKKVVSTGKGLENIKRRLELLYPDKHKLDIRNDGRNFHVSLEVNV